MSGKKKIAVNRKNKVKKTGADLALDIIAIVLGVLVSFVALYPLWYILVASFSRPYYVSNGEVLFMVKEFTLAAYQRAFSTTNVWRGYANTIFITVAGVAVSMFFSTTLAYALSKPKLKGCRFFVFMLMFTMWFSAGTIPFYQTLRSYKLTDSYWGLIIAFAINSYNVIILRSFFEQVPHDFEEAAQIDGASTFRIFGQIYLPLSKAALATVTLFYMVSRWNGYFWASILLTTESKQPLQVVLKKLLIEQKELTENAGAVTAETLTAPVTISYAFIVISIIPMLIVYPFIQKYFKSGVTLGGVKS